MKVVQIRCGAQTLDRIVKVCLDVFGRVGETKPLSLLRIKLLK